MQTHYLESVVFLGSDNWRNPEVHLYFRQEHGSYNRVMCPITVEYPWGPAEVSKALLELSELVRDTDFASYVPVSDRTKE